MPSGEYKSVRIADIIIPRSDRTRKEIEPKAIEELAESIQRIGLIHAPVVSREMVLVAGERRLTACESLGWDRITVQWADTLEPNELLSIEIEENIKRLDLPWQDQCDALLRYHNLQKEMHPEGWTQEDTAKAIGLAQSKVSDRLAVAQAVASGDERAASAKVLSTAVGVVRRKNERAISDEAALLGLVEEVEKPTTPFSNMDFNLWAPEYSGPPFNFIHCDFPYGINADKFDQAGAKSFGGYADTEEIYWQLVSTLTTNKERLLGKSGHILFWFSMKHYGKTLLALQDHFWVDPYPVVWHKSDNQGTLPDPQRGPRRIYEVAFVCSFGDRKILSSVSNVASFPTVRTGEHMSEKSEDMLQHFFRMFVDGNTRMLDPTCGSGSSLRAASKLGATSLLGLEINPEFLLNAERAWERRG